MYKLCRHFVKTAIRVKLHKHNSLQKLFPRRSISSNYRGRLASRFQALSTHPNLNVSAIDLKKKLRKLDTKYKHDLNLTTYSLDRILNHPFFDASHVSREEGCLMLKCCELINDKSPEALVQCIWKVWDALVKLDIVDLKSYHCLLLVLLSTGVKIDLNRILVPLQKLRNEPTDETYNLLLRFVCQNNSFDDVQSIISTMDKKGHRIDEQAQYAIVYATAKCRGFDSAIQYVRDVPLKMNSNVYTSLLRSIAEASDLQLFNRMFTEANENKLEFDVENRISIVESLIKGNLNSLIPNVLGEKNVWRSNVATLCNLSVRSLHSKRYDAAFVIIDYAEEYLTLSMPIRGLPSAWIFAEYITSEMVKSRTPLKDILQFCSKNNIVTHLKLAAYTSLRDKIFDYTLDLYEEMKRHDLPLRPHYFWPLLLSSKDEKGIFDIQSAMRALKVDIDFDTLLNYVYPRIDTSSTAAVLEKLRQNGITEEISVTPLIGFILGQHRLSDAIELCQTKYGDRRNRVINYEYLYTEITKALVKTKDFESIVKICRSCHRLASVFHYFMFHHRNEIEPEMVKKFVKVLIDNKVGVFQADLNELQTYIDRHNLTDISVNCLLNEVNKNPGSRTNLRDMNIEELEEYIVYLKNNNYSIRQALRRLLIMHADIGNCARVLEVKEELEDNEFEFSVGMRCALMKVFCKSDNFEKAYEIYLDFKNSNELEQIDLLNIMHLATAAAKHGDLEAMYEILKSRTITKSDDLAKPCLHLMEIVTEYHGLDARDRLFKFLVNAKYCQVNIQLLEPIVKQYLSRQDVERAALACLDYGNLYGILPMKNTVLRALASLTIEEKSLNKEPKFEILLNKFLQLSGYLYGPSCTNIMYVICLAKINMLATLRSFLMESYTGTEDKIMWTECNKLGDRNSLQTLINLETVFKDMSHNMEPIYINLLKIYCRKKDRRSAEKLLKSLEDSNRLPSITFSRMYRKLQNGDEKT